MRRSFRLTTLRERVPGTPAFATGRKVSVSNLREVHWELSKRRWLPANRARLQVATRVPNSWPSSTVLSAAARAVWARGSVPDLASAGAEKSDQGLVGTRPVQCLRTTSQL